MDGFAHLFLNNWREKTENKYKRGRWWAIFEIKTMIFIRWLNPGLWSLVRRSNQPAQSDRSLFSSTIGDGEKVVAKIFKQIRRSDINWKISELCLRRQVRKRGRNDGWLVCLFVCKTGRERGTSTIYNRCVYDRERNHYRDKKARERESEWVRSKNVNRERARKRTVW